MIDDIGGKQHAPKLLKLLEHLLVLDELSVRTEVKLNNQGTKLNKEYFITNQSEWSRGWHDEFNK